MTGTAGLLGRARPTTPEPAEQPAVLISHIKAQAAKKTIVSKTDVEVWSLPDQEIVEASKSTWRLKIYGHYDISLC
ncbi:hypothetical protein L208DRAFT_428347 [Tricholoma matsutake]|nr:hypothetical protein L208DRAFT_428347 [Tricholoma matsutake 945]